MDRTYWKAAAPVLKSSIITVQSKKFGRKEEEGLLTMIYAPGNRCEEWHKASFSRIFVAPSKFRKNRTSNGKSVCNGLKKSIDVDATKMR